MGRQIDYVITMPSMRTLIAGLIAMCGAATIVACLPPVVRWNGEQTRADIRRALRPLASIPFDAVTDGREHALEFAVPADPQWNRITRRLGTPVFLLMVATDPEGSHPEAYSVSEAGMTARATSNGQPVSLALTRDVAYGYSFTSNQTAYQFAGRSNDALEVFVRTTGSRPHRDARVMVFAHWNPIEVWDWTDGTAMGQGFYELFAPFFAAFGLFLFLIAIRVGRPRRPQQLPSS